MVSIQSSTSLSLSHSARFGGQNAVSFRRSRGVNHLSFATSPVSHVSMTSKGHLYPERRDSYLIQAPLIAEGLLLEIKENDSYIAGPICDEIDVKNLSQDLEKAENNLGVSLNLVDRKFSDLSKIGKVIVTLEDEKRVAECLNKMELVSKYVTGDGFADKKVVAAALMCTLFFQQELFNKLVEVKAVVSDAEMLEDVEIFGCEIGTGISASEAKLLQFEDKIFIVSMEEFISDFMLC